MLLADLPLKTDLNEALLTYWNDRRKIIRALGSQKEWWKDRKYLLHAEDDNFPQDFYKLCLMIEAKIKIPRNTQGNNV